ncbi:MAG: Ig-like domain-containing protein [Verrucomicrobiota bacterium]
MHDILRYLSVGGRIVGVFLAILVGVRAAAQGVLNTSPGVPLVGAERSVVFDGGVPGPLLKLSFGFSTDEIPRPGVIPDSFTITLQDTVANQFLVLVNMDAAGTVWAPVTPGTVLLPPESIDHAPIPYSSLTPLLANRAAYEIEMTLPSKFQGRPLTIFYDLYSNDNGEASQAWFSDAVIVPEPGMGALLVLAGLGLWWSTGWTGLTRLRRIAFSLALIACLGVSPGTRAQAAEKAFRINDTDLVLAEVTSDADVYFRSMRLNRALNVWNVEMVVSNKSTRVLSGPIILLVDSVQGTSGLVGPDGVDDSQPAKAFLDLSGLVGNGSLSPGEVTTARTLTLGRTTAGSPTLVTRLFAARPPTVATLAVTRSLDDAGRPLPDVSLTGSGPSGALDQRSDSPSGVASFGRGAGEHQIRFSREGYLPVWRRGTLLADQTTVVPNPRLTPRSPATVSLTPLGGTVISNAGGGILLQVPPGAVVEPVSATLTPLSGQNLPFFLPKGWSPLSAFWLETSGPLQKPLPGNFKPSGPISPGETAALVRWDEGTLDWRVVATLNGRGSNFVSAEIGAAGAYALVAGDPGALAPPAPIVGQPLGGSASPSPDIGGLSATGTVTPSISPASVIPEQVTGIAHVLLRHSTSPLPSGTLLRGEVTETYHLRDGGLRLSPQYEEFIVGYQRPGDADPLTVDAEFPMRPLLLFGPDQLAEATVRMDVLPEQPFDGQVLDPTGGQISVGNVRLIAGRGRMTAPSALRLRRLDPTAFTNLISSPDSVVAAFDLTVDSSTLGGSLVAQLGGLPPGGRFVLARILSETGYYGLQPVERLQSDTSGGLKSLEPTSGERLPGLRGSGQYVLISVDRPQGLVSGVARNGAGVAKAGMPVSLSGLPWLALTDGEGRYQLVAPAGTRDLTVRDPATGDAGIATIAVADPGIGTTQDVGTAPHGPRVARITPAAGAVRVPRVGSVVVEFDEAVNPGTVVNGIQLLKPDNSSVPASLTLNLANRVATLSPANELDPSTTYQVHLAPTIRDPGGLPLEGTNEFSFTTVPLSTRDPAAQLIIYQPGATNVPASVLAGIPAYTPGSDPSAIVVHGTPGTADPEVPVILVNESTGETATVLSKADGSFNSIIPGSEQDFVSATFVNLNGTRVYVPVSRQLFDNGFVGLYPQGGILEAQSDGGPVQILIEPKAIEQKAKLRVRSLTAAQFEGVLGGVKPSAGTLAAAGLRVEVDGSPLSGPMKVRFPVNLRDLGYATNAPFEPPAVALAMVRDTQDETSFEILDQMLFTSNAEIQAGRRASQPALVRTDDSTDQLFAGVLDTAVGFIPVVGGPAQLAFNFVVAPLLIGPRPVVVKGKTMGLPADLGEAFAGADLVGTGVDVATGGQGVSALSEYLKQKLSKPISGAFVALETVAERDIGRPGRIKRGMVYSTSGRDGSYLMIAPSLTNVYLITATAANYQDRQTVPILTLFELGLAGAVYKNFFFEVPALTHAPPSTHVAHTPLEPAPGTQCEVEVNSSSGGGGSPPKIRVDVKSVTSQIPGVVASLGDAHLTVVGEEIVGSNRKRWRGLLRVDKAAIVRLRVNVLGSNDQSESLDYPISFGGRPDIVQTNAIPSSDPEDPHGPVIVATIPPDGGVLGESGSLLLRFDKAISREVEENLSGITLNSSGAPPPVVRLSQDQKDLTLQFSGLNPGQNYNVTVSGLSVRDLNGRPLDQRPSTPGADNFTMRFTAQTVLTTTLPGIQNGRGAAISGNRLYALEMTSAVSYLVVYDITNPALPTELGRTSLFGQPRDLLVIPDYSFKLRPGGTSLSHELVAVVGGDLQARIGGDASVDIKGQYLWIFDMEDPRNPTLLASPVVSYRVGSAVVKVRWEVPNLTYQEFNPEYQHLGVVNLQELIRGYAATPQEAAAFERDAKPGKDLNNDGDYVDEGEELPTPALKPIEFYGKQYGFLINQTSQRVNDFDTFQGFIGVALGPGYEFDPNGALTKVAVPPSYRTVSSSQQEVDWRRGSVRFEAGANPKRVSIHYVPIQSGDTIRQTLVALVSLAPDSDGQTKLSVIDISLPESPKELNRIIIPNELSGGQLQSVVRRRDGVLELATAQHVLELNPVLLGRTNLAGTHPSIVGFTPGAGGGQRSLGSGVSGVHAVLDGGKNQLVQTAPTLSFVRFPERQTVVNPTQMPQGDPLLQELFSKMQEVGGLVPARFRTEPELSKSNVVSHLSPPLPAVHYHILVHAPGFRDQIELGLEALNAAGRPVANKGFRFPPVRAVSELTLGQLDQKLRPTCDAPIRSLPAYRVSNDPGSPFYNYYLSRPFALIYEDISLEDLKRLQGELDREILWSSDYWRAFIDPVEAGRPVVGPFAAAVDRDRKVVVPIASQTVRSFPASYVAGRNPPPAGGHSTLSGTYGTVSAHNGEVRMTTTDFALPSRRMGIRIDRSIGGQDNYDGPFGLGWDFNYNQRLTELDPNVFPIGLAMPLINRGSESTSVIASGRDLIFHTGGGRMIHFRWVNDTLPSEYATDPLVREFKYGELASDYYLGENGVFDLLVRFKDGKYERLTPDGIRYRYNTTGRLESMMDRFPKNRHDLEYDSSGLLVRIDDRSVSTERFLEFGYYRREGDPDFNTGLDEIAPNSFVTGKICRLRDFTGVEDLGRHVLFFYSDEGLLIRRESFEVSGENGGYSGRSQTHYFYDGCKIKGIGVGKDGTPLFTVDTSANSRGTGVARGGNGVVGAVGIKVPAENTAANVLNQTSVTIEADGRITETQFDRFGYPTCSKTSGGKGGDSEICQTQNQHGLVTFFRTPEGRTEECVYDENNPMMRARANLLRRSVDPGPRGGDSYTEQYSYDPRYNQSSGVQKDANGFTLTYTISPDGRSIRSIRHGDTLEEVFEHNEFGQLLSHVDCEGVETAAVYDSATGFLAVSRQGENATQYEYGGDVGSRMGKPPVIRPPRGSPFQLKYNRAFQEVEIVRGSSVKQYAYDEQGRLTRELVQLGDGRKRDTRLTIDPQGFVRAKKIDGVEVDGKETAVEYLYTPDPLFRVASIEHPGGALETIEYDNRGDVATITLGDYVEEYVQDRNGNTVEVRRGGVVVAATEYDGFDRPKTITRKIGDRDYVTRRTYYPAGQLRSEVVTDPDYGVVSDFSFPSLDALGRPKEQIVNGATIQPKYQYEYGKNFSVTTGPKFSARQEWNSAGYRTSYSDPILSTTITPDANGNVETVVRAEDDGASYVDRMEYDDLDHQTLLADRLGDLLVTVPRTDGMPLKVTNARGNATETQHTALGELQRRRRADGMEFRFEHDPRRQIRREGDPEGGFGFEYDEQFRMTKRTLRNGAAIVYGQFDARNQPKSVTIPGGKQEYVYDLQTRPTSIRTTYEGTSYVSTSEYDALSRIRRRTYVQDGGPENVATAKYDTAGPVLETRFEEDGMDFKVRYTYESDARRRTVEYPSGVVVTEDRDATGRLTGISDARGPVYQVSKWNGSRQPGVIRIGGVMQQVRTYDNRGRAIGSRTIRLSDGVVLTHLRYKYDSANNIEIAQSLHRLGKAENFSYDAGERVSRASFGVIPLVGGGFSAAEYARTYGYDAIGRDFLVVSGATGPVGGRAPPFSRSWSAQDAFLQPGLVDGFARGDADPLGNVRKALLYTRGISSGDLVPVAADLTHNGLGNLVRISRADGITVENRYQPGLLRHGRTVRQGGTVLDQRSFVYDVEDRLLEEYDVSSGTAALLARYYYFSSDIPVAADLRDADGATFNRYYYLQDLVGSVIAVADASGQVIERVRYETFGQPQIETADSLPPTIRSIVAGPQGALIVQFSEAVAVPLVDPGPGGGIVRLSPQSEGLGLALTITAGSPPTNLVGSFELLSADSNAGFDTRLQFTPEQNVGGRFHLSVAKGVLVDEWGNSNAAIDLIFTNVASVEGTVLFAGGAATSARQVARSTVGSPFLFQGQYFDYETGLIYLRARYYDPFSGMFLEPDPSGYEDSVNPYAGFGNNPVTLRDPSGTSYFWEDFVAESAGPPLAFKANWSEAGLRRQSSTQWYLARHVAARAQPVIRGEDRGPGFASVVDPDPAPVFKQTREERLAKFERGTHEGWLGDFDTYVGGRLVPGGYNAEANRIYRGSRTINLGLYDKVTETTAKRGGMNFLSHYSTDADARVDRAIEIAAGSEPERLKPKFVVNVQGWKGDTLEEKVNFAILRGARGIDDGQGLKLAPLELQHAPNFEFHAGREGWIRPGLAPGDLTPGVTDREMFRMYKSGVLHRAVFVEGEDGLKAVKGQRQFRMKLQKVKPFTW